MEFPFYYLPPIECVDYKKNFIQNFLDRLLDMRFIQTSQTIRIFLDDAEIKKIEKLDLSSEKLMEEKIFKNFATPEKRHHYEQNELKYN